MLSRLYLVFLTGASLYAQTFDVASIRPHAPDDTRFLVRQPNGGHFTAEGAVGKLLVMLAYGVQDSQITGAPAGSERRNSTSKPNAMVTVTARRRRNACSGNFSKTASH